MRTAAKWVVESWAQELKTVLQFLTAEDWTISTEEKEPDDSGTRFWWTQEFSADRWSFDFHRCSAAGMERTRRPNSAGRRRGTD